MGRPADSQERGPGNSPGSLTWFREFALSWKAIRPSGRISWAKDSERAGSALAQAGPSRPRPQILSRAPGGTCPWSARRQGTGLGHVPVPRSPLSAHRPHTQVFGLVRPSLGLERVSECFGASPQPEQAPTASSCVGGTPNQIGAQPSLSPPQTSPESESESENQRIRIRESENLLR